MSWKIITILSAVNIILGIIVGLTSTVAYEIAVGTTENPNAFTLVQLVLGILQTAMIFAWLGFSIERKVYLHAVAVYSFSLVLGLLLYFIAFNNIYLTLLQLADEPFYILAAVASVAMGRAYRNSAGHITKHST